jgi:hypothetical protein
MKKGILARLILSVLLAVTALAIFLISRKNLSDQQPPQAESPSRLAEISSMAGDLDREVDSVLSRFGVETDWIQKRQIALPNSSLQRIERRIAIPRDIVPVQLNQALNLMAKRYHARAIASENLRENTVTIHIEVEGIVTQTLILKPNSQLERRIRKIPSTNV